MLKKIVLGLSVAALLGGAALAQDKMAPAPAAASNIKRTPLQKVENFPAGYNIVTVVAEIAPNTFAGRHTHPGVDTGYCLEGSGTFIMEGKPDQEMKPGFSYAVPAGVPHDVKAGPNGVKVVAAYIVEKDKPVATPAPK